jgi:transposase
MKSELKKAYERGDVRAVRRLSVLMMIGERMTLALIVTTWNICEQTVYNWLNTFLSERWDSIEYGKPSGRPARLTKTQKRQLYKWVKAGPEKAGYSTGCWSSVLIQDLINQKFHVLYNRF